jgi:predicted transcriptional regulator
MSTTTIRLPEDLKERIVLAAERAGTTAHAFILNAIADKVDEVERRNDFHATAKRRYEEMVATGQTVPWDEMQSYLKDRLAGKKLSRPKARKRAR